MNTVQDAKHIYRNLPFFCSQNVRLTILCTTLIPYGVVPDENINGRKNFQVTNFRTARAAQKYFHDEKGKLRYWVYVMIA